MGDVITNFHAFTHALIKCTPPGCDVTGCAVQGLPFSASELNLAAWASPGTAEAGDLRGIPRNFSLSDLTFDQEGLPRITSLSDFGQAPHGDRQHPSGHSAEGAAPSRRQLRRADRQDKHDKQDKQLPAGEQRQS